MLFVLGGFANDPEGVLATVQQLAPVFGELDSETLLPRCGAHESDNTVRAPDSRANPIFPTAVVWIPHRYIDEFVGRPRMKGLSF